MRYWLPFRWGSRPPQAPPLPTPSAIPTESRSWQPVAASRLSWDGAPAAPMAFQALEQAVASAWTALVRPATAWGRL